MHTSSPELVAAAKKLRTSAVAQLLENEYPAVYRLACGLAGREDVGRGIAKFVLARSIRLMPNWDVEDDPRQWFYHFTILTARRAIKHQPKPANDVLVTRAEGAAQTSTEYLAFIAALRALPRQQIEAFLLHHGEKLNTRYTSLAMDCSTEAATAHLLAAVEALKSIVPDARLDPLVQRCAGAYARLTPDEQFVPPSITRTMLRHFWPRKIWRIIRFIVQLIILGGLIWGGWWLYRHARI
jgi:DNA-directed RNA polymerase specialized sigma24 family protein